MKRRRRRTLRKSLGNKKKSGRGKQPCVRSDRFYLGSSLPIDAILSAAGSAHGPILFKKLF